MTLILKTFGNIFLKYKGATQIWQAEHCTDIRFQNQTYVCETPTPPFRMSGRYHIAVCVSLS